MVQYDTEPDMSWTLVSQLSFRVSASLPCLITNQHVNHGYADDLLACRTDEVVYGFGKLGSLVFLEEVGSVRDSDVGLSLSARDSAAQVLAVPVSDMVLVAEQAQKWGLQGFQHFPCLLDKRVSLVVGGDGDEHAPPADAVHIAVVWEKRVIRSPHLGVEDLLHLIGERRCLPILPGYLAIKASTNGMGMPYSIMPCLATSGGISW